MKISKLRNMHRNFKQIKESWVLDYLNKINK